jgi:hypothetical protein
VAAEAEAAQRTGMRTPLRPRLQPIAAKEKAPGEDKEQSVGENKGGKRGTPPDQKGG